MATPESVADLCLPAACLIAALVLLYRYVIYPAALSPLARVPAAHWSCSFSPAWILWARFDSRENHTLHAAHRRLGPVVRVGPSELSVDSVDAVKTIYQGGFDKHPWYSVFDNYGVPCTFSAGQAKSHSLRKRMVSHVYSKSYLHTSPALAAQARAIVNGRLLPALRGAARGVDVHSLFCAAAMDFIAAYCFGVRRATDFIRCRARREHWLALYTTRKGYGFFAQELPALERALGRLRLAPTPSWVRAANRELEAWCRAMSDAALRCLDDEDRSAAPSSAGTADDPVVVRALRAGIAKEARTRGPASPLYATAVQQRDLSVASETLDHILAGQETTGVALTYLSWHLSQSPALQRELRAELLSLAPNMRIPDGGRRDRVALPDPKQLDALPILHAVITETVRRYAPAGGPEPRVTPAPSCRIGPYEVPAGVRVSASAYNLHRNEAAFPDPETWDHTRWLRAGAAAAAELNGDRGDGDGDGEKNIYRHFWGFSSGGRMCLGSNFAMHDMKLIVAAIYSNYVSRVVDDTGIEQTDAYTGHPRGNALYLAFERVV
ncbi:cytochrome P450 [Durotheca rogersii]|uniref:cytochrome P450 n=1 Tax=Durotheca rogersii TaxID=419775 RepID=UPI00221EE4ED|nr:cytochrome P450 [Durotheca rogersii]KAI5866361.1 cytochrome P450 [Durotheca rogersii]